MYLLDANVFIQAKNDYYGFDFCPGFWNWLENAHTANRVFSVDRVKNELTAGRDELSDWARALPSTFFLAPNQVSTQSMNRLTAWANQQGFTQSAILDFFSKADYYLVAQAHALGFTVVTQETRDDSAKKRVKIPNACNGMSVNSISPFDMLRSESVRLII